MKFTIIERKMKISDDVRAYALRKVEKLDRYFHSDSTATLTFKELKSQQTVELTVEHNGIFFRAEETTTDMFASIDGAISHIERQIRKNKTRLEKRLREGAFTKEHLEEIQEEPFEVVRHKQVSLHPMSVEEAILQMNLLGHLFFFFLNADNQNAPSVLYQRANGGYGLMESQ